MAVELSKLCNVQQRKSFQFKHKNDIGQTEEHENHPLRDQSLSGIRMKLNVEKK